MLAFALEEFGDISGARRTIRDGLKIDETDGWLHHALAHTNYYDENPDSIVLPEFGKYEKHWHKLNSFLGPHLYWHKALLYLEDEKSTKAIEVFDKNIWVTDVHYVEVIINAVQLLWKLSLYSIDKTLWYDRWSLVYNEILNSELEPGYLLYDILAL
eukprot:UN24402